MSSIGAVCMAAFSVAVWRGETAYVAVPDGVEIASGTCAAAGGDGVSVSYGWYDDVPYETKPGGVGMRSRPDVLREWVPGRDGGRRPTVCIVRVSPDAKPGVRSFPPLEVNVLDRVLPPPSGRGYHLDLWQHPWAVARYFGVEPFSEGHYAKMEPVWRTLAECGSKALTVTLLDLPWNHQCHDGYRSMVERVREADGSWRFGYGVFDEYVAFGRRCGIGPDIACYTMCPWGYMATWREADGTERREKLLPGTAEFEGYWGPFLEDFAAHLKSMGWFADAYIAMDERSPEDVRAIAELVRRKAPGLKIAMAGDRSPSAFRGIDIDSYSQALKHLTDDFLAELGPRRARGQRTTLYVCCTEERPNTFMCSGDDEAFWLGAYPAMAGFDGFLRWAANSWPADPYADASFKTRSWRAGDTFLVYPNGEPSARLVALRAGIVAAEKLLNK